MIIAIDGPAGAGKSTVARAVAAALGATYLDSGAMYRVVALRSADGRDPVAAAREVSIGLGERVTADGEDVTEAIRAPEVTARASEIAAHPDVRSALVQKQRELLYGGGDWVAEGRDIGTVVAPDAELKVFLTASEAERARRRAHELGLDAEDVRGAQAERDRRDATRDYSPLKAADEAVQVDTTELDLDQVVDRIVQLARDAVPS
ncbi:MAG TPA: (d)CMP kinase [Solirubrobacterales bacterium]|jgi:cytidylate kinase|nr:(d)CMP kinase [Solirubrobacterales bacterium]